MQKNTLIKRTKGGYEVKAMTTAEIDKIIGFLNNIKRVQEDNEHFKSNIKTYSIDKGTQSN